MTIFFWDKLNEDFNKECQNSFFSKGSGISVGSFDGIHKGHRLLINSLTSKCHEKNLPAGIVSFVRPLPSIKNSSAYPGDVSTLNQRLKIFEELKIDFVILVDFNPSFASLSGTDFFSQLIKMCNMKVLAEGIDFRCGYKGQTDSSVIKEFCNQNKIDLIFVDPVFYDDNGEKQRISSSNIRNLILKGDISSVSQLLQRDYELELPEENLCFSKKELVQVLPSKGSYSAVNENNQKVKFFIKDDSISIDKKSTSIIFNSADSL